MPDKVLVRPDGTSLTASEKEAESLKKLGYREQTDEERSLINVEKLNEKDFSTTTERVKTGLEGFASGLTLGGYDLIRGDNEYTQQRAKYNPGTRIVGEIVGALAPALATGGSSVGARALAATPAGKIAKIGSSIGKSVGGIKGAAAGAAFEGAIGTAGAAMAQAKLNGDPITVESVLAAGGIGAVFGGALGAAGERLTKVLPVADDLAGDAVAASTKVDDNLDEFFNSLPKEPKAKVSKTPEWKNAVDEALPITNTYKTEDVSEFVPLESFGTIRAGLDEHITSINTAIKDVDKYLGEASSSFATVDSEIGSMVDKVSKLKGIDNKRLKSFTTDLRKAVKAKDADAIDVALGKYVTDLEDQLGSQLNPKNKSAILDPLNKYKEAATKAKELITLKDAVDAVKDIPDNLESFRKLRKGKVEKIFASLDTLEKVPEMANLTNYFDKVLEDMGVTISGSTGTKARAIWESDKTPGFFKAEQKRVKRTSFKLDDMPMPEPGVTTANVEDVNLPPKPSIEVDGIQFVDSEIEDILADKVATAQVNAARRKKGSHGFWHRVANSTSSRISSAGARKAGLGMIGSALAFQAGGSITEMILGGAIGSTVSGGKTSVMGRITSAARRAAPKIGQALKTTSPRFGSLALRIDGELDKDSFEERVREIHNIAPIARDKAYKVVEDIAIEQPEFAKSFIDTVDNAVQGLKTLIPKDPGLAFSNGKSLYKPDPIQKIQTGKALAVFHDPQAALDYISEGNQDFFIVKAVQTMFPALWEHYQTELLSSVIDKLPEMSYNDMSYYSSLTGVPLHSSFSQRSMAQTQALYINQEREEKPSMGGGNKGGGRPAKSEPPTSGQSLLQV